MYPRKTLHLPFWFLIQGNYQNLPAWGRRVFVVLMTYEELLLFTVDEKNGGSGHLTLPGGGPIERTLPMIKCFYNILSWPIS